MSARDHTHQGHLQGASHHPEIFLPPTDRTEEKLVEQKEVLEDDFSPEIQDKILHETYGAGDASEDPLQLEHMVGFGGEFPNSVVSLPLDDNLFTKCMGSLIAIENMNDPHDQTILRAHDMQVSALAVSPSGELLASGQLGTRSFKGNAAPIFVWSTATGKRLVALRGLTQRVNIITFSTDEKFLCGCGEDCLLYVWELSSGEVVFGQRNTTPVSIVKWVEHYVQNRRVVYDLAIGVGTTLSKGKFYFDQGRVQWTLSTKPYALPSGGLVRHFASIDHSEDCKYLFVGTTGADMIVYRHDIAVFRALIPICSNGVRSMVRLPNGDIVCGGGDGSVTKVTGEDLAWEILEKITLDGPVVSLSLSPNGSEVLAGCSSGSIFRCMTHSLASDVVTTSHTSAVTTLAFGPFNGDRAGIFATGTRNGELRVWDIADYACTAFRREVKAGAVLCLALYSDNGMVVSGWEDGFIRCHDISLNRQIWYIPQGHRGGTTSIAICDDAENKMQFMVSGGADGAVRVWRLSNRELMTQYSEHSRGVSKVLIDNTHKNIVHSVSLDCTVLSYDLKTDKRKISHIIKGGYLTHMTQRLDSECELITCDTQGRLLHWDIDVRDPVLIVMDAGMNPSLKVLAVSPSGRFLAFAGDDTVLKVLDVASNQVLSLGKGHSGSILTLSWTPDERQIITGSEDSCMCVWNFYLGGQE
mmetsp:Transcript_9578/g.14420  ORF Transcript_9578/g.14420 Transcript_9578/m.14420 type:complete len:697 (-) Transcript_9578:178-2268(-)|eukprot:CAMPEP_0185018048 /NCGR_PEP_ID=MMETSP1103-20130426/901_1 /TAXON_ID=36769 /ORGANISM="Paraphysomonas bandaiensis, Strain Caron Lab Isolate" /LENGTH=696 /DNA_ID=CAMNT_0027547733 /DNA_START=38 /DNA_END=2128 /DNA_ORIENTATION=-